jgi:hypothetical protein
VPSINAVLMFQCTMQSLSSGRIGQEQNEVHYVDLTAGVRVGVQSVVLSNGQGDSRYISLREDTWGCGVCSCPAGRSYVVKIKMAVWCTLTEKLNFDMYIL